MGYQLLRDAIALRPTWTLTDRAYITLLYMALTALDQPTKTREARHYYAGWTPLAMQLGYETPSPDQPLGPAAKSAVARAISELTETGLIKPAGNHIRYGKRARVYLLTY
jgi:hypothetical protein